MHDPLRCAAILENGQREVDGNEVKAFLKVQGIKLTCKLDVRKIYETPVRIKMFLMHCIVRIKFYEAFGLLTQT